MYYQPHTEDEAVILKPKVAKPPVITPDKYGSGDESCSNNGYEKSRVEEVVSLVTSYACNLFFVAVFLSLQVNGVFMLVQTSIVLVVSGIVTFAAGTTMQLLEIIQPPNVMKWIPLWRNTIGRGLVICFVSTLAMHGVLIMGLVTWILSIVIICAPLITGTFDAPPPLIKYNSICPLDNDPSSVAAKYEAVGI